MAVHLRYQLWYISLPSSIKHQRVVEIRFFFYFNQKITISLVVIGLRDSYFPLIQLPSCYQTVLYVNHF